MLEKPCVHKQQMKSSLSGIYTEEHVRLSNNPNAATLLPAYASVPTIMHCDCVAGMLPLPPTRQAIVILQAFWHMTTNSPFLLAQEPINRFTIFATTNNLNTSLPKLHGIHGWHIWCLSDAISQLYSIYVLVDTRLVPVVYIMMADKTAQL